VVGRVLELKEEAIGRFPRAMLQPSEVLALSGSGKFEIEPPSPLNNDTYGIRSRGWVGHVPVGNDLLVRILPKIAIGNLFRMLEVAYNLRSFRIFDGEIGIGSIEDLYERIVSILSRRILDRARKGLYRAYVRQEQELGYVRGRLDPVATMLNVARGKPCLPCSYEEHTADVDDNRILLWTLHEVRRQAIRQPKSRRELDLARRALTGSIMPERRQASDCVKRLYNRLNDDYGPLHGLCRFILEQSGPDTGGGDRTFIPFVLNMPSLFEAFVAEWLRQYPPPGMVVRSQHTALLDADCKLNIRIDIVLNDESTCRPIAVLDTKYVSEEGPVGADLYQIAFYAREMQARRGLLIYPSASAYPFRIRHGNEILLESIVFDLAAPLEEAGHAFRAELMHRVRE
jgi:5-methylcytosine-specific restriction enzyme subunit McrC